MNRVKILIPAIISITFGCTTTVQEELPQQRENVGQAPIELTTISKQHITDVVECTGKIEVPPNDRAAIHAPVGANITDIRVLPGDYVKKGAVLFTLSHQNIIKLQKDYLVSWNELATQKINLEHKKQLFEAKSISGKELREAQRDYNVARANFESAGAQLAYIGLVGDDVLKNGIRSTLSVKAPIAGYVASMDAVSGSFVDMNDRIMTLVNTKHKHIELDIYSDKINLIRLGQSVGFHLAGSQQEYRAKIRLIGREVEASTRTVKVHADLVVDDGDDLVVGSNLYAGVMINADSLYSLPQSAIVKADGKYYVLVKEGSGLDKKEVKLGKSFRNYTEIVNYRDLLDKQIVADEAYYHF